MLFKNKKYFSIIVISILCLPCFLAAQQQANVFSHQDSLRGSIGSGRLGWNVLHYEITVEPDYLNKTIKGSNIIRFYDEGAKRMQIDMQEPMIIDSVVNGNKQLPITREGNVYWADLRDPLARYKIKPGPASVKVYFHGKPKEAVKAPWDGGWIWKKDKAGNPWMSVACQGLGASVWYPCKDYQGDEPDSGAILRIIVADSLVAVGNGRMIDKKNMGDGRTQYSWQVKNPINNYNIVPYIGKYSHFSELYAGEKGKLDMDYWVLNDNVEKAKKQFADAPRMIKAFEYWFGPYPFYEDGYKLVEAPHLGMEHQGAIAYGNGYRNGYMGRDRSGSGWGMKFDFIIVHESGHEWFANNITSIDMADMWIHESFTNYSETLFTDYYYGKEAGNDYITGSRINISNDEPIISSYGVNSQGSGDMYDKGGNMLHNIRQLISNDKKFRQILRGLNKTFYHKTVNTADVENYMIKKSGKDLAPIFDQYLRHTSIPVLEYKTEGDKLFFRWSDCIESFNMPVKISFDSSAVNEKWIYPVTGKWKKTKYPLEYQSKPLIINRNFYVKSKKLG